VFAVSINGSSYANFKRTPRHRDLAASAGRRGPASLSPRIRSVSGLFRILVEILLIVLVAAALAWVVGATGAPSIVTTVIWVLAAVAIVLLAIRETGAPR
jgi:ABC-type branched-subunit amino acid transport system permease subunit